MAVTRATGVHKIHSTFSASGGVFSFYRDNASTQFAFGENGTGLDVKFFGDTAGQYALWDESADTFNFNCAITASGLTTFSGAVNLTGSAVKVGDVSTDKIGFFNQTPAAQPAFTATSAQASTIAINVLEAMRTLGLMSATG